MANELRFIFSSMNSGKSLMILTRNFMLKERGFKTILMKPDLDDRSDEIYSRLGISESCVIIKSGELPSSKILKSKSKKPDFVLVDEAQFLTKAQVLDLAGLVDNWGISVYCYGLKLDWQGNLFEGSHELIKYADTLEQVDTFCKYNKGYPALFHIKTSGDFDKSVETGFEEKYESVSRKTWMDWNDKLHRE
jgi:thymidine kinase